MNIRGPKSYEDLRTINGVQYNSLREHPSMKNKGNHHQTNITWK